MSLFRKKDPFGDGSPAAGKKPKSRARIVLIGLLITLVFGLIYFYFALPAINLQNPQFYVFIALLCGVFCLYSLFASGQTLENGTPHELAGFLKKQCKVPVLIVLLLIVVFAAGYVVSLPIFRASSYRDL